MTIQLAYNAFLTIITLIITYYFNRTVKAVEKKNEEQEKLVKEQKQINIANNAGTKVLLKCSLEKFYKRASKQHYMSMEDKELVDEIYKAYHAMGGNGGGTRFYEFIMKQPIYDDKGVE